MNSNQLDRAVEALERIADALETLTAEATAMAGTPGPGPTTPPPEPPGG